MPKRLLKKPKNAKKMTFFKLLFNVVCNIVQKLKSTKFGESISNMADFQFWGFKKALKKSKKFRHFLPVAKFAKDKHKTTCTCYYAISWDSKTHPNLSLLQTVTGTELQE